ncbi:MAG: GNAT family N-acetyltransferase [Anaerolineales bacterium]|nr:GNAT family N-acetyltransferase [Anaerolineales bacterium]
MSRVTLQPATAAHEEAIKALIRSVRINPLGLDWRRFVVAVGVNGRVVGCGQVKPHGDGSRELASIAVAPGYRRQGVARAIITELLGRHAPPLWLTCMSPLVPFYAQFGFREVHAPDNMPPYFRRVVRLMRLFTAFSSRQAYLAVMVRRNAPDHPWQFVDNS